MGVERVKQVHPIERPPILAGHRMISPRCALRNTVEVNELIETYLAKKRSSTAPSRKTLVPSKAVSSHCTVISRPRPKLAGPGTGMRLVMGALVTDCTPSI